MMRLFTIKSVVVATVASLNMMTSLLTYLPMMSEVALVKADADVEELEEQLQELKESFDGNIDLSELSKADKKAWRQKKSDIARIEKKIRKKKGGGSGMGGGMPGGMGGGMPGMDGANMPDFQEMLKDPKKMEEMMKMLKGMGLNGAAEGPEGLGGLGGLGDLLKGMGGAGGMGGLGADAPPGDDEL